MRKFDFFFKISIVKLCITFQFYIKKNSFEVHFVDVAQEIREQG